MLSKLLPQKLKINLINVDLVEESATLTLKSVDETISLPSINELFPNLINSPSKINEKEPVTIIQVSPGELCNVGPKKGQYTNNICGEFNRYTPYHRSAHLVKRLEDFLRKTNYSSELSTNYHQHRSRITPSQIKVLEMVFEITEFPVRSIRAHLSKILGLPIRSVQIWFQNRRQKVRLQTKSSTIKNQIIA